MPENPSFHFILKGKKSEARQSGAASEEFHNYFSISRGVLPL